VGDEESRVKRNPAGWPKRRVWRGLRRYTLYGPSIGIISDQNGGLFQGERFILERRGVAARFHIDVELLRAARDPERARRDEIDVQIKGLEAWRREHRGSRIVQGLDWGRWEGE